MICLGRPRHGEMAYLLLSLCGRASHRGLIKTYLTPNTTIAHTPRLIAHERAVRTHLAQGSSPLCMWSAFISSKMHNSGSGKCPSALAGSSPMNISLKKKENLRMPRSLGWDPSK